MLAVALAGALAALPGRGGAQDLADFDYENLSFRGVGAEWGRSYPNRVDEARVVTARFDLGYLGPGLRIVPSIAYWTSNFKAVEVADLEQRVGDLIVAQGQPRPTVDLGQIKWTDVALSVDAHVVWRLPMNVLSFAGVGAATHILNGSGPAIDDTFIEDLLDSATVGLNLHAGFEYPLIDQLRVTGQGRYEIMGDLQYLQAGIGLMVMFGELAPGELRDPS